MTIKLRYIDPVSDPGLLPSLAAYLAPRKPADTEIELVCLRPGLPRDNLEYHSFEALVSGDIVKAAYDASQRGFDAVAIGCFYDLCLLECREIAANCIVTAPCQASLQIASSLANRVSILIGRDKWQQRLGDNIARYGYRALVASLVSVEASVASYIQQPEVVYRALLKGARRTLRDDRAEALVLGCSANFAQAARLQRELGVVVIEPVLASIIQAAHHARLNRQFGWATSRCGSLAPPPQQPEVSDYFSAGPAPIGQRLWVT